MKVLQILILTIGLIILANILSKVSAQNSNTNNTSNRNNSNSVVKVKTTSTPAAEVQSESEDHPVVLKQISMQRVVEFPKNGKLQVQIIEEINEPFTIRFANQDSETVAQFVMKNLHGGYVREYWESAIDPKARFKVIAVEGVPSPVIHLAMVQPGGSDHGFWSALFGEINGKIKLLTPVTTRFSIEGGIHIGELGKGKGTGIAVWNSIWGDGESHYGEHIYEVDFYNFNRKLGKFVKTGQIKTKQKQEGSVKALESLGLGFYKDAFRDFPEFLEYREDI